MSRAPAVWSLEPEKHNLRIQIQSWGRWSASGTQCAHKDDEPPLAGLTADINAESGAVIGLTRHTV